MKKQWMMLFLSITFLSVTTLALAEDVYVTKNGKKYHTQDCRFIQNKGAQKITKEQAIAKGLKPCPKCMKDEAALLPKVDKNKTTAASEKVPPVSMNLK